MFQIYLSKLHPGNNCLWQRPKNFVRDVDIIWYDNAPLGRDKLGKFMPDLSADANLMYRYTNHSVCATSISGLDEAGFEGRHITSLSGHKNESSLKSYAAKCPINKKREMSDTLSSLMHDRKAMKTEHSARNTSAGMLPEENTNVPSVSSMPSASAQNTSMINPESDFLQLLSDSEENDLLASMLAKFEESNQESSTMPNYSAPSTSAENTFNIDRNQNSMSLSKNNTSQPMIFQSGSHVTINIQNN